MKHDRAHPENERAFVLHTYPYRDTSVVVEAFTPRFGRIGLIARGAKRPKSPLRGALLAFQPLVIAWSGRGELRTLTRAEWIGAAKPLVGMAMMCGYYLNELVLKLLQRDDPHECLFDHYASALARLAEGDAPATVLRAFELALLQEIGYAVHLHSEAESGLPLRQETRYAYVPERGPVARVPGDASHGGLELHGKTLLDMARGDFSDPTTAAESKALMRWLLAHHLEHRSLHTRQMLLDLQQL